MVFPIFANAAVTKVEAGAGAEDYDAAASAPTQKWAGSKLCWVNNRRRPGTTGSDQDRSKQTSILLDGELAGINEGDIITYSYMGLTNAGIVSGIDDYPWNDSLVGVEVFLEG